MIARKALSLFIVAFAVASLVAMVGCVEEKGVNPPETPPEIPPETPPKTSQITISFDANGGIPVAISPVAVDSGKALGTSLPADPTRAWYAFTGWFDEQNYGRLYTESTVIWRGVTLTAGWADTASFIDSRDHRSYNAVKIGNYTWMAENLNYSTDSSWCYDNADSNCVKYGRLYAWNAAKSACPNGWRLPDSSSDWRTLMVATGGVGNVWGDAFAYEALKSANGWDNDGNGTNKYGFSAMPGGYREDMSYIYHDGRVDYRGVGLSGCWWLADEDERYGSAYRRISSGGHGSGYESKSDYGCSVRCVR